MYVFMVYVCVPKKEQSQCRDAENNTQMIPACGFVRTCVRGNSSPLKNDDVINMFLNYSLFSENI